MIPAEVFECTLRGFLSPVLAELDDVTVTEILINGPGDIFVERKGKLTRLDAKFKSVDALMSALRVIAQYVGRAFDAEHPILEGRLPDGSRVEALLPPIAPRWAVRCDTTVLEGQVDVSEAPCVRCVDPRCSRDASGARRV